MIAGMAQPGRADKQEREREREREGERERAVRENVKNDSSRRKGKERTKEVKPVHQLSRPTMGPHDCPRATGGRSATVERTRQDRVVERESCAD